MLVGGAVVAAFTFLDPAVARVLLPFRLPAGVLVGLAGVAIFAASLVQMKMDWGGRSALHGRAAEAYLEVKHELGWATCLAPDDERAEAGFARLRDRYEGIAANAISVPDRLFPKLKQLHLIKVEIAKALDQGPGASMLLRWKFWWRDDVRGGRL
jgi:hypothetical protein